MFETVVFIIGILQMVIGSLGIITGFISQYAIATGEEVSQATPPILFTISIIVLLGGTIILTR